MKFPVATSKGQGHRDNDFCWTMEGEPVFLSVTCSNAQPDDSCGCDRALSGILTRRSTTTIRVAEAQVSRDMLFKVIMASEKQAGWWPKPEELGQLLDNILEEVATYDTESILEFRHGEFTQRNLEAV